MTPQDWWISCFDSEKYLGRIGFFLILQQIQCSYKQVMEIGITFRIWPVVTYVIRHEINRPCNWVMMDSSFKIY